MVWHILKKDMLLMWPAASVVACVQLAFTVIEINGAFGAGSPILQQMGQILLWLWLMAAIILIVTVVHQDAPSSSRQDWLVRPIRRTDVLFAKFLFALILVQGPAILSDLVQGLLNGFPTLQIAQAVLVRAILLTSSLTLPALLLGAVTRSTAEAMVLGAALFCCAFAFTMVAIGLRGGYSQQFDPTNLTGEAWITNLLRYVLLFLGAATIFVFQYRTRKTVRAIVMVSVVSAFALGSEMIPWNPVFSAQKGLATEPGSAKDVSLTLRQSAVLDVSAFGQSNNSDDMRLTIPLMTKGLPSGTLLKADKTEVILTNATGQAIYSGASQDAAFHIEGTAAGAPSYDQILRVSSPEIKGSPAKAAIHYSMTLFRLKSTHSIPALGGSERISGFGLCKTRITGGDTRVEARCLQIGKPDECFTYRLEDTRDGSHNPDVISCNPSYGPFLDRPIPNAMTRGRIVLPFRDPSGQITYPVDSSKLKSAQIVIHFYEPIDHFSREIVSPLASGTGHSPMDVSPSSFAAPKHL